VLVADIASRPGLWKRAGQAGTPCGIDWGSAVVLIPSGFDRDRIVGLMRDYEAGLIEGAGETAKRQAEAAKRNAGS
jgi:hypothetical protein